MDSYEVIHTEERDGWQLEVALGPDYDYRPGEDDDIYPQLEEMPRSPYGEDPAEQERDYDGRFMERAWWSVGYPRDWSGYDRGTEYGVSAEEMERVIRNGWGDDVTEYRRRKMRRQILEDAEAIISGQLTWAICRVRVSSGNLEGSAYLGGIDYDTRQKDPDSYILSDDVAGQLFEEARDEAARAVVGPDYPLALGVPA